MSAKPGPIILPYRGMLPKIDPRAFIAPGAVVIGDVEIAAEASVWFGCVLRGDVNVIRVGPRSNLQDGTIVHVASEGQGTFIGANCTIGHCALLHACTLEDDSFVGMRASAFDGAKVSSGAMLGSGAMLTRGKIVPPGQIWAGSPAKHLRDITPNDQKEFTVRAAQYVALAQEYLAA
ncbi:MAG: gamma carbonic anhydrase family protein [Alphaproteobacteria bacterium]|nr:gamma carbonic anhydrase family protein [Alphaproteobacteria bacterium]